METWKTFGHNQVKNILQKQLESKVFPHAYLFFGPEGIGKKTLAEDLSKKILGTENLNNHPDFQTLEAESEVISAELIKDFIAKLAYKPFLGKYKVAVINNAQNFNKASGNALLKTLEEPSPSTIIILIASGHVLPTIVSRCQVLRFSFFKPQDLQEFAKQENLNVNMEALNLAFGSSARLMHFSSNESFLQEEIEAAEFFKKIKTIPVSEKFLAVTELAEKETPDLKRWFSNWMYLAWQSLERSPQNFGQVRNLIEAIEGLDKNFNKKLVLQGLIQKL